MRGIRDVALMEGLKNLGKGLGMKDDPISRHITSSKLEDSGALARMKSQ